MNFPRRASPSLALEPLTLAGACAPSESSTRLSIFQNSSNQNQFASRKATRFGSIIELAECVARLTALLEVTYALRCLQRLIRYQKTLGESDDDD